MKELHLTQFGVEIPKGFLCSITMNKKDSFDSCSFNGKVENPMGELPILACPIGNGFIASHYQFENRKLQSGDNFIWLPIMKDCEMAFTGETILIEDGNDIMYGKIYWD